MNLFEIDKQILGCVDEETGEVVDLDRLESLNLQRDEKISNICKWIINLKSDAAQLKEQEDRFKERRQKAQKKAESLKNFLLTYMNGRPFKTAEFSATFRKSSAVEIINQDAFEAFAEKNRGLLTFPAPVPNKTAIKAALDAGEEVPGAAIKQNTNLIIK